MEAHEQFIAHYRLSICLVHAFPGPSKEPDRVLDDVVDVELDPTGNRRISPEWFEPVSEA